MLTRLRQFGRTREPLKRRPSCWSVIESRPVAATAKAKREQPLVSWPASSDSAAATQTATTAPRAIPTVGSSRTRSRCGCTPVRSAPADASAAGPRGTANSTTPGWRSAADIDRGASAARERPCSRPDRLHRASIEIARRPPRRRDPTDLSGLATGFTGAPSAVDGSHAGRASSNTPDGVPESLADLPMEADVRQHEA